jgi:hypothetical protein
VFHELGHVLGYDHHDAGVMDDTLTLGTRRIPDDEFASLFAETQWGEFGEPAAPNAAAIDQAFSNE